VASRAPHLLADPGEAANRDALAPYAGTVRCPACQSPSNDALLFRYPRSLLVWATPLHAPLPLHNGDGPAVDIVTRCPGCGSFYVIRFVPEAQP
jgi:hypothetical protein